MDSRPLSSLADLVISTFEQKDQPNHERKLRVNPVVSKVASWYEKLRNAMEYHEEEVILRVSTERILKRRLLLGGNAQTTAEPLVRELIWAGYMKDDEVPESTVEKVEKSIDLYLALRLKIIQKRGVPESVLNEWTYQLMSSDIAYILHPNPERQTISNFMYHVLQDDVTITDDSTETRDAQIFIAVRRAFAKDDMAFLRYQLFQQFFGKLSHANVDEIANGFQEGHLEILRQLKYPRREKIYSYVKKRAAVFLILEDILRQHRGEFRTLALDTEKLKEVVHAACEVRYKGVSDKVRRAIIRSVIFIIFTKVIFAFAVEGTYERIVYGEILWRSILLNTGIPPLLMILVSFFIRTPGVENSKQISHYIHGLLYEDKPRIGEPLVVTKKDKKRTVLSTVFAIVWFLAFFLSFGAVVYVLSLLEFNIVSQGIFLFFLAIVSFLSYRISLTANTYRVGSRQGFVTPFVDFFFVPVIQVGRRLTQGISQVNFLLFIFDFIIDTPFKVIFSFTEQLFHFLHSKRDELE